MTCDNCIHGDLCVWIDKEILYNLKGRTLEQIKTDLQPKCRHFKNKSDFVEVETIKSWLYEMALNNVGCHIEGDFSTACEEIISRFGGLKRYSIEKEGADNG
jgi:hypothetical protein